MLLTTIIALLAAALFGVSTALQHRSAGLVSEVDQGTDRVGAFIVRALRHPLWIIGAIADIGGFVLHALALRLGPLTVVQPLLVSSIVFSVVLRELLERRSPRRSELVWATALTIGLVMFLAISAPSGRLSQPADPVPPSWGCSSRSVSSGLSLGAGVIGVARQLPCSARRRDFRTPQWRDF